MQRWSSIIIIIYNLLSIGLCADNDNLTNSINSFTNSLQDLMCSNGLSVGGRKCKNEEYGMQDFIYSFSDYFDNEIINASIQSQSIMNRLNNAINLRASLLTNLSLEIQELCNDYHSSGDTTGDIFDSLYFSGNADLASKLPSNIEYNEVYGNDVCLTTSTFKIPNNVDYRNEIVRFDATISSLLTNTMVELHNTYCMDNDGNNVYCSMYFGMRSGVFRQFPGKENSKDNNGVYKSYDPRYRPWYVSAVSGNKDIIILLDISGSMLQSNRLSLAKSAVLSVLNTLSSNSMVNIVAFSSSTQLSCFGSKLVRATAKNIQVLTTFVNTLNAGGGTDFQAGFTKVFDLFDEQHAEYGSNCHSSILFLTDGIALDPSDIITDRNDDINAVIFSYTLGDGADNEIPSKVADLTNGIYKHIADGDVNLISAMSSYYLYYAHKSLTESRQSIISSPYLDFDTNVIMITMALPIYINNTYFVGVVGTDIPLTMLSEAIGDITIGRKTYSFVMNGESELILHPFINHNNIGDSTNEYIPTYVTEVEPVEYTTNILENMLNGEYGAKLIESTIKQSAGNVEYEGYVSITANLLYIYSGIGGSSLSMAIVIYSESDIDEPNIASFGLNNSPSNLCLDSYNNTNITQLSQCIAPFNLFHSIDLMLQCDNSWIAEAEIMNGSQHNFEFFSNRPISTKYPAYYLQSGLFEDTHKALNILPTCSNIEELHDLTNRIGIGYNSNNLPFGGFRNEISDTILTSIYILTSLHEFWKNTFLSRNPANSSFVQMYFASYIGIMISYPAHSYNTHYNPLLRPWYQRSISYPNSFTFTTPYKDATSNKLVITGSTVIFAPNSTYPFGVAGFDFSFNQFILFWTNIMNNYCDVNQQIVCYLFDSSAFLVYYDGMEDYMNDTDISYKFLGELEPTLFQSLLENEFFIKHNDTNYMDDTIDITYIVNDVCIKLDNIHFTQNNGEYSIKTINETNLYLVVIENYFRTTSYPSTCPNHEDCTDVYTPGCIKNNHNDNCQSAQINACLQFANANNNQLNTISNNGCNQNSNSNSNSNSDINYQCLSSICPKHTDFQCYEEDHSNKIHINSIFRLFYIFILFLLH